MSRLCAALRVTRVANWKEKVPVLSRQLREQHMEFSRFHPKIEVATTNNTRLGEGPYWDNEQKTLYYTDILEKTIFRFDPATKKQTSIKVDGTVSFIIPLEGARDKFIISVGRRLALLTWDGEGSAHQGLQMLKSVDDEEGKRGNQINDGKADPVGRIWTGTVHFEPNLEIRPNSSSFFSFSLKEGVKKHLSDISCSNGIAWSENGKTMFYVDSFTRKVEAFDFNVELGTISNRRTAFDFELSGVRGFPDGMTIDTNDRLWVACAYGSHVIQIDPYHGKLLRNIRLPSPHITSVVFGGENLDELYVTSGSYTFQEAQRLKYPTGGCVYRVTGVGAMGLPMNKCSSELN